MLTFKLYNMKRILLLWIVVLFSLQGFSQLEYYKGFREGFKEGYCHGDVGCVAPAAPVSAIEPGEKFFSYKDGYNNGYAVGIQTRQSNLGELNNQNYNQASNKVISMYNPNQQQQYINAVVQRQAIFDQNKSYSNNLTSWISILKSKTKDQKLLNSLENYRKKLISFSGKDYSTLGNEIRNIERGIDLELNNAILRGSNSYNSPTMVHLSSDFHPGDQVKTSSGGPFRISPNINAKQIGLSSVNQVITIVRKVDDNYYEVIANGQNAYISKAFLYEKIEK